MNKDCDPIEQLERQLRLERLYEADGRHANDHPNHGLYTGLIYTPEESNAQ